MAKKLANGLYCVQMYLREDEYLEWEANRRTSGLTESSYCRVMNLLPRAAPGPPAGSQNRLKGKMKKKQTNREERARAGRVKTLRERYLIYQADDD